MNTRNYFASLAICIFSFASPESWAQSNDKKSIPPKDQWADVTPLSDADLKASAERRSHQASSDDKTARANKAFAVARYVRKNMNDPSSFELENALVSDSGGVCLRVRGKNSFNAKVLEEFSVTAKGVKGKADVICGPKSGAMDVSFIKHYL